MKLRTLITAGILMTFLTNTVHANTLSAQAFVTKASIANQFEIESSKLALSKSQNSDVTALAQTMIDDHRKTGDQLQKTLQSSNSNSQAATELDTRHQQLIDKLDTANGNDFDRQYIAIQTQAHKEAVSLFSTYSKNGKDAALREFAAQTLPTLQQHLDHVQQLKTNIH